MAVPIKSGGNGATKLAQVHPTIAGGVTIPPDPRKPIANIRGVPIYSNPAGGQPIPGNTGNGTSIDATRNMLIQHGYNVDPTGGSTPRLVKALMHFQKTSGKGVDIWNAHNPTQQERSAQQVLSSPTTNLPFGGQNQAKTSGKKGAQTAPLGRHQGTQQSNPFNVTPDSTQVNSNGALPGTLQELMDQYSKSLNPANINLQKPTLDPEMYSQAQANMEYGPVIGQLKDQIGMLNGAEPGAEQNIANYYKPVNDLAATATATGAAAGAKNVADQSGMAAKIAASLGLSGAAAGGLAGQGASNSDFASNLAAIMNQQNAQQQVNVGNNQQQAETTQQSNNINSVAALRSQLLGQIAAKGQAQTKYQTDAEGLKQQEQTNYINNEGTLLNQKTTAALALPQIASAYQGLTKNQQGLDATTALLPGQVKGQNLTNALNQQRLLINGQQANQSQRLANAQIFKILHPANNQNQQLPWNAVSVPNRVGLGNQLHKLFSRAAGPNAALSGMIEYTKNQLGYSGPQVTKFIKSVVNQNWAKSNPNAHWDDAKQAYVNKQGKKIG